MTPVLELKKTIPITLHSINLWYTNKQGITTVFGGTYVKWTKELYILLLHNLFLWVRAKTALDDLKYCSFPGISYVNLKHCMIWLKWRFLLSSRDTSPRQISSHARINSKWKDRANEKTVQIKQPKSIEVVKKESVTVILFSVTSITFKW